MLKKILPYFFFLLLSVGSLYAQEKSDSSSAQNWSSHFQQTIVIQHHPSFSANYSGENSMLPAPETKTSLTSTLFIGRRLWNNGEVYFNAELAGGQGFADSRGAAGFPNGEIYRVDNPSPQIDVVRFYLKQIFPLSDDHNKIPDDVNQIETTVPDKYILLAAGKFSVTDFFDVNKFSSDPRTQFLNWSIMHNGAWDYPADTKGYTLGFVAEFVSLNWSLRFSSASVPTSANGMQMEYRLPNDHSETFELEHRYTLSGMPGAARLLLFLTHADMGNYRESLDTQNNVDVTNTRKEGRTKYGAGINLEQLLSLQVGFFLRAGWNDGLNETWMYTEIERTISAGLLFDGNIWNRKDDTAGAAFAVNAISKEHQNYLKAGGVGFIIGDGNLNYAPEIIGEFFYSLKVFNFLFLTPDYQLILNPAYNRDRGPVNVFSLRLHTEI